MSQIDFKAITERKEELFRITWDFLTSLKVVPFSCWKICRKYDWTFNLFRITYQRGLVNSLYGEEACFGIIVFGFGLAFSRRIAPKPL